jgi:hypothetical protein
MDAREERAVAPFEGIHREARSSPKIHREMGRFRRVHREIKRSRSNHRDPRRAGSIHRKIRRSGRDNFLVNGELIESSLISVTSLC